MSFNGKIASGDALLIPARDTENLCGNYVEKSVNILRTNTQLILNKYPLNSYLNYPQA